MKKIICLCIVLTFNWVKAQDYRFGKVSKAELSETAYPLDAEANAAVLYVNQKTYYNYVQNDGFVQVTDVYKRIKIYNKDGYDWATEEVRLRDDGSKREYINGLKATTYTLENGKIETTRLRKDGVFDERNNKYWKTTKFTMPNIQDGCVIEFEYKIHSPYISINDINLQYGIPIKEMDMYVRIPEYFNFNKYINPRATFVPKLVDSRENRKEQLQFTHRNSNLSQASGGRTNISNEMWDFIENKTEIKMSNIPALKSESYVGNINNYRTKLIWEYAFSKDINGAITKFASTWDEVTKTIYDDDSFGMQLKTTRYFENDIDHLLKDATTNTEKINLIFDFVKSKVKWNDYYGYTTDNGVRKAYKEGVGNVADINLMLTAMLRYARIKANPMLISTRSNDIPLFPATGGFNYVVAAVETLDDVIILDATDKFAVPNILPVRALNWQGRIVRDTGSSGWYDLTPKDVSKEYIALNVKINEDLTVEGKVRGQLASFAAKNFRDKYQNYSQEQHMMELEKNKGEIEVSNYKLTDMQVLQNPVKFEYEYNHKSAIEKIGDKVFVMPMLFFAPKENLFKQDSRTYPIDFVYGFNEKYHINLTIPDNYVVESLPESSLIQFNDKVGEFKYIAKENGKLLQFMMTFDMHQPIVLPEHYADFKEFYQYVIEKQTEKIVLKKL